MFTSNRTFQLWHYTVSHGQLLIRSPKGHDNRCNSDIVFVGVTHINVPTRFRGLQLRELTALDRIDQHVDKSEVAFILECGGIRGWVLAAACKVYENDLDIFDSGLEWS